MAMAIQDLQITEQQAEEEEELEELAYDDIDRLQDHGINQSDIKKLKAAHLYTVQSIMMSTDKVLTSIKGMTEAKVDKLRQSAQKCASFGFQSGTEVLLRRKKVLHISTGAKSLDEMLGGGLESQSLTEVFGEFRTGKTQLCHTMAVTAQLPVSMGGGNGKVIYIDTEGTFRPERILEIAEEYGVDGTAVLDNISHARALTSDHQTELLMQTAARLVEEHYSLLIVDSCTALYRTDYSGRGMLAERQQKLGQFLLTLIKLSEQFNIAVLITNQVVSDPGGGAMFITDMKKPIGGNIMAHASTTRLYLRKGRGDTRICKIYDSPSLPEADAMYQLSKAGVRDVKD